MEDYMLAVLPGVRVFSDFSIDELAWVSDRMEVKKYPDKSLVCDEGGLGSELYIILAGTVRVTKKDANKKDHEIAKLGKGSCFGEMALVDTMPRSASVYTLEETQLAIFSQISLDKLKKDNVEVYAHILMNLAKEFSRRLRSMDDKYIKVLGFFF
jgi:CRP/FNR family transcriptional regulator, cyclic AMP receptor protein